MRAFRAGVLSATVACALSGCGTQHAAGPPATSTPAATWQYVNAPQPGPNDGAFSVTSIAMPAVTDIWAVGVMAGGPGKGNDGESNTLAFHYDGHAWTREQVPGTQANSQLNAVAATSPTDVWAVGSDTPGVLVDHFDGHRWTARNPAGQGVANAVTAVSAHDVWVAGTLNPGLTCTPAVCTSESANDRPLLLHFDGAHWTRAGGFLDTDVHAVVTSLASRGPGNVWASGSWQVNPHSTEGEQPLIAHWDGHSWTRVDLPQPPHGPARVDTIVATGGRTEVWATGSYGDKEGAPVKLYPYLLRFDGTHWHQVPTTGLPAPLTSVAPDGRGGLWATDDTAALRHFDGTRWTTVQITGAPAGLAWNTVTAHDGRPCAAGTGKQGFQLGFATNDH